METLIEYWNKIWPTIAFIYLLIENWKLNRKLRYAKGVAQFAKSKAIMVDNRLDKMKMYEAKRRNEEEQRYLDLRNAIINPTGDKK